MERKLKIGVFGVWRGLAFIKAIAKIDEADVAAICDRDESKIREAKKFCPADVKVCADFDELIHSGIDAVVLGNYFDEHAPFAIKAMEAGVDVFSETTPAFTLKECVELVEAVERTGRTYALAENYPFYRANREITRVYQTGVLGEVVFAEGEYVHPMSPAEYRYFTPAGRHWRNGLPTTYYCTHALSPLMSATGLMPKRVIGKVSVSRGYAEELGKAPGSSCDNAGILLVEMSNGSVFRVAGDCQFGTRGNWYRLGCQKGSIENQRGSGELVRLCFNSWDLPKDGSYQTAETTYLPLESPLEEKAKGADHGGSDFFVTWNFIQDLVHHREPFMNVYRAVSISAVGILGWRSALDGSRQLEIPDFSDPAARDQVRDDALSPLYHLGQEPTLPNFIHAL